MTVRSLRRWALVADIVAGLVLAVAIGIAIVKHGPSFGLGLALAALLWFLLKLTHPPD